jgi:hypothetical protein
VFFRRSKINTYVINTAQYNYIVTSAELRTWSYRSITYIMVKLSGHYDWNLLLERCFQWLNQLNYKKVPDLQEAYFYSSLKLMILSSFTMSKYKKTRLLVQNKDILKKKVQHLRK